MERNEEMKMNRPKYPPTVNVSAIGLADAWQKLVKICLNEGAYKKRFYGKPVNTLDIISLTEIRYPTLEPMLHPQFPTKELHLAEYKKQWERDYDWRKQGFEYSYMDRLTKYPSPPNKEHELVDQLGVIKERIAERIEKGDECLVSNRDQAITWRPSIDLFKKEDQPCLQRIQFFVHQYPVECEGNSRGIVRVGKGEIHVTWRSRDLYAAWNSNLIGLIGMVQREVFTPNNIELVRVVDFCNSNHIYEGDWASASLVKPIAINPMYANR